MVLIRKKKKSSEELEADRKEKELRKSGIQDEFQAKGFELVGWARHHKKTILAGASVFALIVVIWGGLAIFRSGVDVQASGDYENALNVYEKAQTATDENRTKFEGEALQAFEKVSQTHSGKGIGRLADLYIGHLALKTKDAKKAVAAYKRFSESVSKRDPLVLVGLLGLANAYETVGEKANALATYEQILKNDLKIDEPMILWQASRIANEIPGQEEKAKDFALKLLELSKNSEGPSSWAFSNQPNFRHLQ